MSLATEYRPTTFSDVLGQGLTPLVLQKMVETEKIPAGLMFVGPAGTGKTTAARIFAKETDSDLIEIDAGVTGSVAEIRSLTESLRFGATRRLVVLDEAHSISREGFNALLKSLEEPTPGVVFILNTTEPRKIPETIKTRLIGFEFRRVSVDVIVARLKEIVDDLGAKHEISTPPSEKLLLVLADKARGSLRQAISLLEKCLFADVTEAEDFLAAEGYIDAGPVLISAMASGDPAKTEAALTHLLRTSRTPQVIASSLISTLRDVQVLRSGGVIEETGTALELRKTLAVSITPEAAFAALSVLWQFQTMLSSEDPASDLRLACVILEKHLNVGRELI